MLSNVKFNTTNLVYSLHGEEKSFSSFRITFIRGSFKIRNLRKRLKYCVHRFLTEKITDWSQMDVMIKVFKGTSL